MEIILFSCWSRIKFNEHGVEKFEGLYRIS